MFPILMASVLTVSLPAAASDTTVELRSGDRVVVERFMGSLSVQGWNRPTLSIAAGEDESRGMDVSRDGDVVTVRPYDRKSRQLDIDRVLHLPSWVDLQIEGRELDVSVSGIEGTVQVRNISGDLTVDGPSRGVTLSSIEGELTVRGARGPVTARSRGEDVSLFDVRGDVNVSSGDGDLHLEDVHASTLQAETLDGDVFFSGTLAPNGTYGISVHDGDATLVLARDADARVSVSTFDGEFTSEFPVTLQGYSGGGTFDFTLGKGSARMEVKVFDGEIKLLQSGGR